MHDIYHLNFLGLPTEMCDPETARFAILPVPYDATCSYGVGARHGPDAILRASQHVELYDPELDMEPANVGVITLAPLDPVVSGPEKMVESTERKVTEIVEAGKLPILLGGEHTVTVGAVRAMAHQRRVGSVLIIDAHADLRDRYQGSPYSHACVTRRLAELGLPIFVAGCRSISKEEMDWVRGQDRVRILWDHTLAGKPTASWIEDLVSQLQPPVYVSIDVDGLNPAIMPTTGTPEPGGRSWRDVSMLLCELGKRHELSGADVVELEPRAGQNAPDFLAARLVFRLLAAMQ